MSVSLVEREQATPETLAFYDKAEERFEMLLNIFKVFGHVPKHGAAFTDLIMEILQDGIGRGNALLFLRVTLLQ